MPSSFFSDAFSVADAFGLLLDSLRGKLNANDTTSRKEISSSKWICYVGQKWTPYDQSNYLLIEAAFVRKETSLRITIEGSSYVIDFETMQQRDEVRGINRKVKRLEFTRHAPVVRPNPYTPNWDNLKKRINLNPGQIYRRKK